ncbi:MAG: sulfurtransferase TusA family protein [Parvibaculum sp.]|uniref:sulfurtransferase TusA family protein n=1 Tax=Parvibaculum sp. TaxID=2024848 RepID=UPI003C78187A
MSGHNMEARDNDTGTPEIILDVMGQQCPLPVLRARKRLLNLEPGTLLRVFVTDPVARIDMPHFCTEAGHDLVETRDRGGWIEFLIKRGTDIRATD